MERGAVILIENDELILIERVRGGRTYYLFPAGGVEAGETREQAAIREAGEELGLHVTLGRLVAVVAHQENQQYYFQATVTGGELGTGHGAEMSSPADSSEGSYRPVRLPLDTLSRYDVRPRALAEALAVHRTGDDTPVLYIDD